jgi:hypothetical protein
LFVAFQRGMDLTHQIIDLHHEVAEGAYLALAAKNQ